MRSRAPQLRQQALQLDARSRALIDTCLARTCRQFEFAVHRYLTTHFHCDATFLIFAPAGASTPAYLPDLSRMGTCRRRYRDGLACDYWHQRHPLTVGKTVVVRHSDHTPIRTLIKTAFFRQHLQPGGYLYGVSLVFWQAQKFLGCLTCLRAGRHGDYNDDEVTALRAIHAESLNRAVSHLAWRYQQEQLASALRHALYLNGEAVAVVAKPHEVVAGSKAALCVLQSWDGNGPLSHKLPRGPITLPGPIRKWYSGRDAGTSSLHPRWTIRLTHLKPPHRQPRASHFLIHLSEKTITYPQRSWHTLTTVERELVRGIMEGRSNPQIAQARGVSPATVKNQFSRLLGKLQLPNRTTLAVCFRDAVMRESHSDEAA